MSDVESSGRPAPTRLVIGAAGVLLGLFGLFRLATQIPVADLVLLAVWLIGALVIHDGILSPVVVGIGVLLNRFVPPRARRYVQGALIAAALITVIALPMIHRQDSQPAVKAILRQDFTANLGLLVGLVAVASLLLYAVRVARDRQAASAAKVRPSDVQESASE